MPGGGRLGR